VDYTAPSLPRYTEPRPAWRKAAIVAGVIAVVELVALVVVALAFVAKPFADDTVATADANAAEATPAEATATPAENETKPVAASVEATAVEPQLPRTKTGVLVLNGNGISGAAGSQAALVRSMRYPVVAVGDASTRTFPRTIVMYRAGFEGEADRFAEDLGLAPERVVPLDGMKPGELQGAKVVLIVGNKA
jgi:LytR cell envelope-related transcriptional attenuator